MASGKYDLLVSLKSDVKQFKKNMHSARGSMRNFTSSVGPGMAAGNAQASKMFGTFAAGRGVIAALVPTINTVKTALVASGIGVLLVGIGVAIAGVTAHINRTVEGSHKWKEAWSRVKAVGDVLGDRLADIGKGIKTMFTNFAKGDRMISGAFMGIFKEIKEETAATVELQKRENTLWREKLDFSVKEAKTQAEIRELILQGNKDTNSSVEKQRFLQKAMAKQSAISDEKLRLAKEELAVQVARMDLGHNSIEDEEKLVELKIAAFQVEDERFKVLKKINEQLETNALKLNDAEKIQKKILADALLIDQARQPGAEENEFDYLAQSIQRANEDLQELDRTVGDIDLSPPEMEEFKGIGGAFRDINNILGLTQSGLFAVENAFAQLGATGKMSTKDILSAVINSTGRIIQAYFAQAIAGMIASESRKGLLGLITGAVGVAALLGFWNSAVPQFAGGGIVTGPTLGMMGEYPGARSNPEVIAPLDELKKYIGGGGVSGILRSDGTQLIAVIESTENRNKMFG